MLTGLVRARGRLPVPLPPSPGQRYKPLMRGGQKFVLVHRRNSASVGAVLFGVSGAALLAQQTLHYGTIWWNKPRAPKRYKGGFEQEMTRREAALILGVRY